jgi:FkbM family methyltransferase
MKSGMKKWIRGLQSQFPTLKRYKDDFYHLTRKYLKIPHERDFAALRSVRDMKDDLYLDVGANHGQSIASIRLFKPNTPIIAFEPVPHLAEKVARLFDRDKNVHVRPYGLGSEIGEFALFTPSYNGFIYDGLASFDQRSAANWLGPHTIPLFSPVKLRIIESKCEMQRLDDQGVSPTFIKIDVQGLEHEVLLGGMNTLRSSEPILMIENFGEDVRISNLLKGLGYEEWRLNDGRFLRGKSNGLNRFFLTEGRAQQVL